MEKESPETIINSTLVDKAEKDLELQFVRDIRLEVPDTVDVGTFNNHKFYNNPQMDRWYAVDRFTQKICAFDTSGNYLFSVGSKGRGPLEFMDIISIGINEENKLMVYDENLDLFKIFDEDGKYVRAFEGIHRYHIFEVSTDLFWKENMIFMPVVEADHIKEPWKSKLFAQLDEEKGGLKKLGGKYSEETKKINFGNLSGPSVWHNRKTDTYFVIYRTLPFIEELNANFEQIRSHSYANDYFRELDTKFESGPATPRKQIMDMYKKQSLNHTLIANEKNIFIHFYSVGEQYLALLERSTLELIDVIELPSIFLTVKRNGNIIVNKKDSEDFVYEEYKLVEK